MPHRPHRRGVRAGGRARQQHACRRARQGRLRGCRGRPARSRRERGIRCARRRHRAAAPIRAGRRRCARRRVSRALARGGPRPAARDRRASCVRASCATTRSSAGPSASSRQRDDAVLHVQKVSGISGSEAHLLSLLPQLRERGWDARDARAARGRARRRRVRRADARRRRPDRGVAHAARPRSDGPAARLASPAAGRSSTRISCTPTCSACRRRARASPGSHLARSTASTSFVATGSSRRADRAAARLRAPADRDFARARRTSQRPRDSTRTFTVVHYGIDAGPEPPPPPRRAAAPRRRPDDPDQGLRRAAARVRGRARARCRS